MGIIIRLAVYLLDLYNILILARVLMSWFMQDPTNRLYQILIRITEPVLGPIRRIMPRTGLDFSPLVAMLAIQVISRLLLNAI